MAVVRTQYEVVSASTTITNGSSGNIDLPRPADTTETNTIDFVKRPTFRKEFESGLAVVDFSSTLTAANVYLVKVDILKLDPLNTMAPLDLSFSSFPDAPGVGQVQLQRTLLDVGDASTVFPTNASIVSTFLSKIVVRAGEFIRVRLTNGSGGDLTGVSRCRYDFGLNAANL